MAMWKYLKEENDNLNMDIQVGPGEEVEASVDCENDCCCENPVDKAKMDPNSIVVAKKDNCEGCSEFYVSCADVVKYADLNEKTVLESLNDIIACNEEFGISASNLVVVMDESTRDYARNLERNGAACMFVNEADDINMDIQVGPNGDAMEVSEDPQEANPVDAVKRQYDSVVVAGQDKDFFVDVEDVQKCADMNCESVIETLNGIIACNEDYDINTGNLHVIVNENTNMDTFIALENTGVITEASFSILPKFYRDPELKKYIGDLKEAERFLNDKDIKTKTGILKGTRIALRIISIIGNFGSVVLFLSVIGIPVFIMNRVISWLADNGEEAAAVAEGKKIISAYKDLLDKTEDEKERKKIEECITKIENGMKKANSSTIFK